MFQSVELVLKFVVRGSEFGRVPRRSGYLDKLGDLGRAAEYVFNFEPGNSLRQDEVREVLSEEGAIGVIEVFTKQILQASDPIDYEKYREAVLRTIELTGQKGKKLFRPIRIAITALASGPELDQLIPVLEEGSQLELPSRVLGVKERVKLVSKHLDL